MTNPAKKPLSHSTRLEELIEVGERNNSAKLNLFVQDEDWFAIEGDRSSLEFLGELVLTFARQENQTFLNLDAECPLFKTGSAGLVLYRKP